MNGTHADSPRDRRFDDLVADYLEAVEDGRDPDEGALLARHPDLAESLQAFFADHRRMGGLLQGQLPDAKPSTAIPHDELTLDYAQCDPVRSSAAPSRPRYLGDYLLLEKIAEGGMGVVYKARQRSLKRLVALKMIRTGQFANAEEVGRFQREAEAAARLDHPGIVPIYQVGVEAGQHYFSMAYVNGPSLADLIRDEPMAPRRAAHYVNKVAKAVAFAHEHGIIHRDIKPANVLVDEHDEPKVTDFGLAKQIQTDQALTLSGQIVGTVGFMPPEQASGPSHQITVRADVYSLGALLYALLTRRPPFEAENPLDVLLQVLSHDPPSPSKLRASHHESTGSKGQAAIPADLETICLKCLEKDPAKRYPTAQALADDLTRFLEGKPIRARPVGVLEHLVRWCQRKPAAAIAVCLVVVIALSTPMVTVNIVTLRKNVIELTREKWKSWFGRQDETAYNLDTLLLRNARDYYAQIEFRDSGHSPTDRVMGQAGKAMLIDPNETPDECNEAFTRLADRLTLLLDQSPVEPGLQSALADCCVFLGSRHKQLVVNPGADAMGVAQHAKAAREYFDRAIELLEVLRTQRPNDLRLQRRAASVEFHLASIAADVETMEDRLRNAARLADAGDSEPAGILRFDLDRDIHPGRDSAATEEANVTSQELARLRRAATSDAGDVEAQLTFADGLRRHTEYQGAWKRYQLAFGLFSLRRADSSHNDNFSVELMDDVAIAHRAAAVMLREMGRQEDALATIQKAIALHAELIRHQPEILSYRKALRTDFGELTELCRAWSQRTQADTPISDDIWPSDPVECYYAILALRMIDLRSVGL